MTKKEKELDFIVSTLNNFIAAHPEDFLDYAGSSVLPEDLDTMSTDDIYELGEALVDLIGFGWSRSDPDHILYIDGDRIAPVTADTLAHIHVACSAPETLTSAYVLGLMQDDG